MTSRGTTAVSKAEQRGAARRLRGTLKHRLSAATRLPGPCKLCASPPFPGRQQGPRARLSDFSRRPQGFSTSLDDPEGILQAFLSPAHQNAASASRGVTILYIQYDPAGNPLTTPRLSDSLGHGFWRVFSGAAADEDEASASEPSAWGSVMPNLHSCLIFFMKILHSAHGLAQFRFTDSGLLPTASAATTSGSKGAVPPCRQSSPG